MTASRDPWLEKMASIGHIGRHRGKVRVRELRDPDRPEARPTGFEIDHADGRREAVVRPGTARAGFSLAEGRVSVEP